MSLLSKKLSLIRCYRKKEKQGKDFEDLKEVLINDTPVEEFSVNEQGTEITFKVPKAESGPVTVVPEYEEAVSDRLFADMAGRVLWSSNTLADNIVLLPVVGLQQATTW